MKNKFYGLFALLAALALGSCTPGTTSESSESGESVSSSSLGEGTSASSSAPSSSEAMEESGFIVTFTISSTTPKPDYVTFMITGDWGSENWSATVDEAHALVPVAGTTDQYSYDFGELEEGSTILYKIVATTANTDSGTYWNYEGDYDGAKDPGSGNPILTVSGDGQSVDGWSFAKWPDDPAGQVEVTVYFAVTIKNWTPTMEGYDGITVAGDWNNYGKFDPLYLIDEDGDGVFTASVTLYEGEHEYEYRLHRGTDPIAYFPGRGGHLSFTAAEGTTVEEEIDTAFFEFVAQA